MNRKGYFIAAVMVPIVGLALFWVARRNLRDEPVIPTAAPTWATQPAVKESEPPAPAIIPALEDYVEADARLPVHLMGLLQKSRPEATPSGILVAPERKTILWGYRDDVAVPIASMTKMMSVLVALETIRKRPDLDLQTKVRVSRSAEAVGGREIWLMAGHQYSLEHLLEASVVFSANDAVYALAESVAPNRNMKTFLVMMNRRARELGMVKARFYNVHGLPERGKRGDNRASCRDLVVLAQTVREQALVRNLAATVSADFRHNNGKVIKMLSTNRKLLTNCPGVNGLKTGYTDNAGYCITAVCERNGETLIAVATGFRRSHDRNLFICKLFDWGFQQLDDSAGAPTTE